MSEADILLRQDHDGVTVLTLNRPERMNALSGSLARAIEQALADCLAPSSATRVIVLTGSGRGFCAGADLSEKLDVPDGSSVLETWYHPLVRSLYNYPIPIVAAVNGVAAGAGMSLALMSDIILCSESATFLQAFVKVGLVPDCGATWLLPRRIGEARAREMSLMAEKLPAARAFEWGLVNRVCPDADLIRESLALAATLANGPINALSRTSALYNASPTNDFEAQIQMEARMQSQCSGGSESLEGRSAFLEKRKPDFSNIGLATPDQTL